MKGKIKFKKQDIIKVPNIGWCMTKGNKKKLNKFYFLHSYYLTKNKNTISYVAINKIKISAIVKKNLIGVQFHPERSGIDGLDFLKNFIIMSFK